MEVRGKTAARAGLVVGGLVVLAWSSAMLRGGRLTMTVGWLLALTFTVLLAATTLRAWSDARRELSGPTVIAFAVLGFALAAWIVAGVLAADSALGGEDCVDAAFCDRTALCQTLFGDARDSLEECVAVEEVYDAMRAGFPAARLTLFLAPLGAGLLVGRLLGPRQLVVGGIAAAVAVPTFVYAAWVFQGARSATVVADGVRYDVTCHQRPGSTAFGWWVVNTGDGSSGGLLADDGDRVALVGTRDPGPVSPDPALVRQAFGDCVSEARGLVDRTTTTGGAAALVGLAGVLALHRRDAERDRHRVLV